MQKPQRCKKIGDPTVLEYVLNKRNTPFKSEKEMSKKIILLMKKLTDKYILTLNVTGWQFILKIKNGLINLVNQILISLTIICFYNGIHK